ncbi:hypothetical protein EMIT0196MI5_110009 [Pseudomonas sp. IT-196MI5]
MSSSLAACAKPVSPRAKSPSVACTVKELMVASLLEVKGGILTAVCSESKPAAPSMQIARSLGGLFANCMTGFTGDLPKSLNCR